MRNGAEYCDILSLRGRQKAEGNKVPQYSIFRKIEQDNCLIIQHIDNKSQFCVYGRKAGKARAIFSPRNRRMSVEYADWRRILRAP